MSKWKTIQSAPKNNKAYQVFVPTPYNDCIVTAFYDTIRCQWRIAFCGLDAIDIVKPIEPTHWRHLPKPPKAQG